MLQRLNKINLRYFCVAAIFVLLAPFLIGFAAPKRITVKYDDQVKEVYTTSKVPKFILMEAGARIEQGDSWRFGGGYTRLEEGAVLELVRGIEFSVHYAGQTQSFKSSQETVGAALKEAGIKHKAEKVFPAAETKLQEGSTIYVLGKQESMHIHDEDIEIPVKYVDNNNLASGIEQVTSAGKPGKVKVISKQVKGADGSPLQTELGRVITLEPEHKVVQRGTALSVKTPAGHKRYSKKIISEATAYTHTGYRTATGIMPYVGVVAVDPRYIPLGSKLYIPGYGMAVAADTGGAIKKWRTDVFLNTEAECVRWGRRNVEVYILEE